MNGQGHQRFVYYYRNAWQPVGGGIHAQSLLKEWKEAGHDVLCLPAGTRGYALRVRSGSGLNCLPSVARDAVRGGRSVYRWLRESPACGQQLGRFKPTFVIARRVHHDLTLDHLVRSLPVPYFAEVNALLFQEQEELWGKALPRWERSAEWAFLEGATSIIANTEETKRRLLELGYDEARVDVVPNGVDLGVFNNLVHPEVAASRWATDRRPVIAYVGVGAGTADLSCMCTAANALRRRAFAPRFLFVGLDERLLMSAGLDSETRRDALVTGQVPHERVAEYLALADMCWAAYRNDYGSPLKQYEYMAMAKPVVIAGKGEAVELVKRAGCGRWVDRADAGGLVAAVESILALPVTERACLGARGRRWVLDHATWERRAAQVIEAVEHHLAQLNDGAS